MGNENWFNLLLLFSLICILYKFLFLKHQRPKNLPPGPWALPVLGHLHLLKQPIHRTLHDISLKYGPVMFLRFGYRKVLVVSSMEAIEECFTKNDIVFANRPQLLSAKLLNYDFSVVGFAPYGDHWRNLKRLITLELLSSNRLAMLKNIREEEVRFVLKQLLKSCSGLKPVKVELRSKLEALSFNIVMRKIAGKRYYGKEMMDEEAREFQELISEVAELIGVSNLQDYFPVFKWVDIQGRKKRMMKLMKKMDNFMQRLVDERRSIRSQTIQIDDSSQSNTTLIDVLLSLHETEPEYTDEAIKSIMLSLIPAGTETSTTTLEWAMTLLLNHPEANKKALAEIESCVGQNSLLEENDLPKLNYLHKIVNETFRLLPPAPLLVPHESTDDCTVCGFHIPHGTMLLGNIWSMQRDPKLWKDPTEFKPERFEDGENEGFKMIPFGAGRRICPGAGLARRVVTLALGALIQSFDWEREGKEKIDMSEGTGLTMPKKEHLEVFCKPRLNMISLLSQL